MELGVSIGQHRKIKELINWLKKKKRRSIRKDELIGFLISTSGLAGRQLGSVGGGIVSNGLFSTSNTMQPASFSMSQQQTLINAFNKNASVSSSSTQLLNSTASNNLTTTANQSTLTNSDLATFREALIMHSK
jgi:hypothetical protein